MQLIKNEIFASIERDNLSNKCRPSSFTVCCWPNVFGKSHLTDIYFHAHSKRFDDLLLTSVWQGTLPPKALFLLYTPYFFSVAQQHNLGQGCFIVAVSKSPTIRHTQPVWLIWTSDQLVAEAATYTTHKRDKHPCPQRDSKPQSQKSSGRRPMP